VGVLVALRSGSLLSFQGFLPTDPSDLITPGRLLDDGRGNTNLVVARTAAFESG